MPSRLGDDRAERSSRLLHDAHCHLDFMDDGEQVAAAAEKAGCLIFGNTVEPGAFPEACDRFSSFSHVSVGLGLHPWWVQEDPRPQIAAFERAFHASGTRFVGEVGLDFGKRGQATGAAQMQTFSRIAELAGGRGGCILSLHAVGSADVVLDTLERTGALANNTCIFHWFSGTSADLHRAIGAGCLFSVNERMASSKRGGAYIKAIPATALLLETDAPPEERSGRYGFQRLEESLSATLGIIAEIKGPDAADQVLENASLLTG